MPTAREEIIATFRGRYAVPVVSALASAGVLDVLLQQPSALADFPGFDRRVLENCLDYLVSIGMLARSGSHYGATELGQRVLRRAGAASIIESYRDYFDHLPQLLRATADERALKTDRRLNIFGSGSLHHRKFFDPAMKLIAHTPPETLVDLGCGDGTWLQAASSQFATVQNVVAVDLSPEALQATAENLAGTQNNLRTVLSDAAAVAVWSRQVPAAPGTEIISMWFVVHEFCRGDAALVLGFLRDVRASRPQAELLVGEIVRADPALLGANRSVTIMPEFLLFHALSGQAPLSWEAWNGVRDAMPYRVAGELLFDVLEPHAARIPASFVWHLTPHA